MQRIPQIWPGWHVDELIGQGGFGRVYKVTRSLAGHASHAAAKIIEIPRDEAEVEQLRAMGMDALSIRSYFEETAQSVMREVAVMDTLKGAPGIVHIEDYQLLPREDGVGWSIFIRMELLEPLSARIDRRGMPDARETAKIGVDICRGLAYCHELGVIHRDIKPDNVFRTDFGEYRVGDFGLARRISEGSHSTMTRAGTMDYLAPEVVSGHYDARVDIYSLGIMLYRWLNGGRPPFVSASGTPDRAAFERARHRRLSGERPPLPTGTGVDRELAAIVTRAIEPRPADRWASASELGNALQGWLNRTAAPQRARRAGSQGTAASPAQVRGPMGIHVDRAGSVWFCQGATSPDALGSVLQIGTVPVDAHGVIAPHALQEFLAARGVNASRACISTSLLSYPALMGGKGSLLRWISTVNALAIDHALRELAPTKTESHFLALHQEGRHVSLALYDWDSNLVLEVVGICATTVEPHESLSDALARLIDHLMNVTGALREEDAYPMLSLGDEGLRNAVATAYESLNKTRLFKPRATLRFMPRDRGAVVRGAALQSMALAGRLPEYLLLEALPFDTSLVFGPHRLPLIAGNTTIPIEKEERICLRAGEDLAIEFEAFDERGLRQRYQLPVEAERLQVLAAHKAALDVHVDVDVDMAMVVTLSAEGWSQSIRLAELSPTVQGAAAGQESAPEPETPAGPEPPASLMELITALDDVDLGLRALNAGDLASPAGAGMVALQGRLLQAIERLGGTYYPALGETFDPHQHEAMGAVSDPTLPANFIVDELRRGFRYQERIIRYSLVRVANPL